LFNILDISKPILLRKVGPFIYWFLAWMLIAVDGWAQKPDPNQHLRCGTMIHLQALLNQDQHLNSVNQSNRQEAMRMKQELLSNPATSQSTREFSPNTLTGPVHVPVVVHIVLPNAMQVSDDDVQRQIDKLNIDYAGINADSVNIPAAFKPLFGKSMIQFVLARRTPSGALTSGIERVNSNAQSNINNAVDPVKRTSLGGLDAWDYTKYLNLWIGVDGSGMGILGYATFPGADAPANQGVFINAQSWGSNACYVIPQYNLGRTLVHEVGHYFGLLHIWGDDGGACTGDDFAQLPGTCTVPASLLIGDTPNQAGSTAGCLNGVATDACSPSAPGFMYQNYMDYTDDACYAMFTLKQVERMEYVIENCRSSYLTSDGSTPPVGAVMNDASASAVVNPGGFEITGCTVKNYPGTACAGSIDPKVRITNNGLDTLTSVKVIMIVDNGAPVVVDVNTSLEIGNSTVVTFPSTNFSNGPHQLQFFTQSPNNTFDEVPSNDTLTYPFNVGTPAAGPVIEGFETSAFPPMSWTLFNPDTTSLTWNRTTFTARRGAGSSFINFYNYPNIGDLDYLITPLVDVSTADSILLSFERAYKRYQTGPGYSDTLIIQVSTSCGTTSFPITVWKKGGDDLSTSPGVFKDNWAPNPGDWYREKIDIKPFLPSGTTSVVVAFVAKNGYGQNLWLDDINLSSLTLAQNDVLASSISNPSPKQCVGLFTPSVDIVNNGKNTLTSARIVYRIAGPSGFLLVDSVNWIGTLTTSAIATVQLKPVSLSTPGNYNMLAYTKLPNNGADQISSNDTARLTFRFIATLPTPFFEGFESIAFPPTGWGLVNQDASATWFRTAAASKSGIASAVINNYLYDARGTNDDLESPVIAYNGIDSAFVKFSFAHATYFYPGSTGLPMDTLQIFITKDCGKTLIPVYNKWGTDLQTVDEPNAPYTSQFIPRSASDWKTETINVTQILGTTGLAQVIFRSKGNYGNALFLDDINFTTKTLPLKLKMNGYLVSPNPFNSSFTIQHYIRPTNFRGIEISNAAGQVVFRTNYNGNAQSLINIDLSTQAAGVYFVKLVYNDKVITERVVKRS